MALASVALLTPIPLPAQQPPAANLYVDCKSYGDQARAFFRKLQTEYPDSAYALFLAGESKAQHAQYQAALELYERAAGQTPTVPGLQAAITDAQRANSGTPAARSSDAGRESATADCSRDAAACDFAAGRYDAVIAEVKGSSGAESLFWLARSYKALADRACAEVRGLPESVESHAFAAQSLSAEGKYREAAEEWRAALKLSPGDPKVKTELAAALFLTLDYGAILPELQQMLRNDPKSANLNFFVGDSLFESERPEEAVPYLRTALKLKPTLLPAKLALGLCEARLNHPAKAIPLLEAAIPLDRDGSVYYQLSRAYRATGQNRRAEEAFAVFQQRSKSAGTKAQVPSRP